MYICRDCGELFEHPVTHYDDPSPYGVSLPSGSYEYYECPECGSDDITEAEECPCCGNHYDGQKVLCDNCMASLGAELHHLSGLFHLDYDLIADAIAEYYGW